MPHFHDHSKEGPYDGKMDTRHQGRTTKNKKTVGVTFVRDPLLGAEPCQSPVCFLELGISWRPHLGNYDQFFLVQTAGLFNIGLADGIPPNQMFASWGPAVSIFTLAPVLRSCLRFCGLLIRLLAVVDHRLPHHLLPGREFYVET